MERKDYKRNNLVASRDLQPGNGECPIPTNPAANMEQFSGCTYQVYCTQKHHDSGEPDRSKPRPIINTTVPLNPLTNRRRHAAVARHRPQSNCRNSRR